MNKNHRSIFRISGEKKIKKIAIFGRKNKERNSQKINNSIKKNQCNAEIKIYLCPSDEKFVPAKKNILTEKKI